MSKHSSIVGGSTAARVLACPGSVVANLTLPPQITPPSEYAEEGTFYHEIMARLMDVRREDNTQNMDAWAASMVGKKFYDRELTQAHIDEAITPALAELDALESYYGGNFKVVAVEKYVKFPGINDAGGTIDLMLRNDTVMLHVDWKFGQGVPVNAVYTTSDTEEQVNPQLMFYTVAARNTLRALYGARSCAVAIIQPRSEIKLNHTRVEPGELTWFKGALKTAVKKALQPSAPRVKGEHCRWAACKTTCPLWTGPLLEAATFKFESTYAAPLHKDYYGQHLAYAKQLVDTVAILKTEVDAQLHAYLSNGGKVPGWRLKAKQKNRQWIDPDTVAEALVELGMIHEEIWQEKLLTFAAADAWAKRHNKKIPDELRVAPPSTETTIAADNDPAPVVEPVLVIEQFRASLRQLVGDNATALIETGNRRTENG